ncbi:MAG: hypothetical protein ACYTG5_15665 [Planctomycetota bacterium]|jgi:hypothetical protein
MSKSRRKAAGCTRGRYKRKKMGKGWLLARRVPQPVKPIDRKAEEKAAESDSD